MYLERRAQELSLAELRRAWGSSALYQRGSRVEAQDSAAFTAAFLGFPLCFNFLSIPNRIESPCIQSPSTWLHLPTLQSIPINSGGFEKCIKGPAIF